MARNRHSQSQGALAEDANAEEAVTQVRAESLGARLCTSPLAASSQSSPGIAGALGVACTSIFELVSGGVGVGSPVLAPLKIR
eukprot:4795638-Prymnesium_polylepis.2